MAHVQAEQNTDPPTFQDDNCGVHRAKSMPDGTLGHFEWSANSQDLDPTEQHVKHQNKAENHSGIAPSQ